VLEEFGAEAVRYARPLKRPFLVYHFTMGNDQNGLSISCVNGVEGPLVILVVGGKFKTQKICEIISMQ